MSGGAKKKKKKIGGAKKATLLYTHAKKKCSHSVFSPQKSRENKPTGPYFIELLPTILIDRWRKAGTADGAGHPWRHESGSRQDRTHDRRGSDGDPEVRVTSVVVQLVRAQLEILLRSSLGIELLCAAVGPLKKQNPFLPDWFF